MEKMKKEKNSEFKGTRVLVLDGYGRQIPTILRQLHDLGCVVTTVNASKLDCGYTSRYPNKKILCPGCKSDMAELKELLDKEITSGQYDVVFPMLEPATDILLTNEVVYEKYVKIIAAPEPAFRKAEDKQQTMMACMDNGIPCPITKRDDETFDEYIAKVGYPIAVKPRKGTGSVGFHCVENEEQMSTLRLQGFKDEENVIQEYIPQTDTQYMGFFMLGENQELKTALIVEKHRWYPIDGGSSCYIQTINRPDLIENGYKLLKTIGWKGEAHLDFIGDPREDGLPKIMEVNGRIPASVKMCWVAGIPLVEQELQYACGKPIDTCLKKVPEGMGLRYFQTDFLWLLKSPNRFKTKPSWFNFKNSKDYIWSVKDPIPFISYTISHLLTFKVEMKKRKR